MKTLFKTLALMLACVTFCSVKSRAEVAKRAPLKEIPAYIEANKRDRSVIFNNAKYDRNAKVYYLYYVSYVSYYTTLDKQTKFLANASRKIYRKGADLIVYIDFSDSDESSARRFGGGYDVPGQAKACSVKSPIVNSYKSVTKRALFKKANASTYHYSSSSYTLRAVDADGMPLAYFYQDGDTIIMRDAETNERKVLIESKFDSSTWEADAILASYKQLVEKIEQQEAQNAPEPTGEAAEADEEEKEEEKPKKKEPNKKKPRWKKVKVDD